MNTSPTPASASVRYPQALTFTVGRESYGVDLLLVQEIRCWSPVTRIPDSPVQLLGVLNLRGTVVPILDLRIRFGMPAPDYSASNVIIVVSIPTPEGARGYGLVVDSVSDVVTVTPGAVMPAPAIRGGSVSDCMQGMINAADQLVVLLDIGALLATEVLTATAAPHTALATDSFTH